MTRELREPIREDETEQILKSLREESLRSTVDRESDTVDPFFVPEELKPDGWTVEWKATHVMGQELDEAYQAGVQQDGWVPAPAKLFQPMLAKGHKGKTVERGGQMLMMRPSEITEKRRKQAHEKAVGQVKGKLESIGIAPPGTMDRSAPNLKQKVNRTIEKMEIPD